MAKDAYRATNRKDILPQMILWLERKEKLFSFSSYIEWRQEDAPLKVVRTKGTATTYTDYHWIELFKTPSVHSRPLSDVAEVHGISLTSFHQALASFTSMRQRWLRVPRAALPQLITVSTWYSFKITNCHPQRLAILDDFDETVHASPARKPQKSQKPRAARFDTVLVNETWDGDEVGPRGEYPCVVVWATAIIFDVFSPYRIPCGSRPCSIFS